MTSRVYAGVFSFNTGISDRVKKVCLLLGKWEEIEGDKLIVETLYGGKYEDFIEEILPYTKNEDPFLYVMKSNFILMFFKCLLKAFVIHFKKLDSYRRFKRTSSKDNVHLAR